MTSLSQAKRVVRLVYMPVIEKEFGLLILFL